MTGFGAAAADEDGTSVRVEVRSVNHRYLQVKCRLPGEWGGLEPAIEALARKKLDRGAVTLNVRLERAARPDRAIVNRELALRYGELLGELGRDLKLGGGLSIDALAALPGVIGYEEDEDSLSSERALILRLVGEALDALIEMRTVEGSALRDDLLGHAREVATVVERVRERMPVVVREHYKNLEKRLTELLDGRAAANETDLARELALLADRMDVSEEVSRLVSHLAQLDSMLAKDGAVGRQLDFLMQECMREANTIGSKCNDAEVAHHVVELKTHVERLREQVQNLE